MVMPRWMRAEVGGAGFVVGQLASLGLVMDEAHYWRFREAVSEGRSQAVPGAVRGERLGELLRKGEVAREARFTGGLEGMGVVPGR